MNNSISDNNRIAKNTILLYVRTLITMAISLYTSRLVLATLGVDDYGIYNVVGSTVTLFAFLRTVMGNATHRYIAFHLGKGDIDRLKVVFSTSVIIHFIIALLVVILAETIGLWLLYNKLVIPADRMNAALWVFQFSVITCALSIICVPYDAEIIAHERMSTFAYLGILDAFLKLGGILLISIISYDKLFLYGLMMLSIQVFNRILYGAYCKKHFEESRFKLYRDKSLVKEMMSFAGWNLVGHMSSTISAQGINIVMNMFFGPVVNAARGVAMSVEGIVKSFVSNFQLAVNPQITKKYAVGDMGRVFSLLFSTSKVSFYLYFIMGLPLFLEIHQVLAVWLVEVPEHTANFLRIVLFYLSTDAFFAPLNTACLATGKTKVFLTVRGLTNLSMLIVSYMILKLFGGAPEIVYIVFAVIAVLSVFIQLWILSPIINLSKRLYLRKVFLPIVLVFIISVPLPVIVYFMMPPTGLLSFVIVSLTSVLSISVTVFLIGVSDGERLMIKGYLQKMFSFFRKK